MQRYYLEFISPSFIVYTYLSRALHTFDRRTFVGMVQPRDIDAVNLLHTDVLLRQRLVQQLLQIHCRIRHNSVTRRKVR